MRASAWIASYGVILVCLLAIGHHVTFPYEKSNPGFYLNSGGQVVRQLVGRPDLHDFYVDYASAHALINNEDAYTNSATLFQQLGRPWAVVGANPHPPTLLLMVVPFALMSYGTALAAWALAMMYVFVATFRLVGVPMKYSVLAAVVVAITFPGVNALVNPVPIVGLGIALAYRYRYLPAVAGLGIALAAIPKGSGVILALPFLAAARLRTIVYAACYYAVAALIPLAWQSDLWHRYLTAGARTISLNEKRGDNASILSLAHAHLGWDRKTTLVLLALLTIVVALVQRDLFWPVVWAMVAALPIAWMYSLLTLLPLMAWALMTARRRVVVPTVLASVLMVSTSPFGAWPITIFPVVVLLGLVICLRSRPPIPTLWFADRIVTVLSKLPGGRFLVSSDPPTAETPPVVAAPA